MKEFKKMNRDQERKTYWEGSENRIIRLWVYALRGLQMLNEFKYLIAGLIALFVILKIANPVWIGIGVIVSIPPLIILGRWQLKKAAKVDQWVSTEYGSVLKYNDYNIKVDTLKILKEISEKLDKLNKEAKNNAKRE